MMRINVVAIVVVLLVISALPSEGTPGSISLFNEASRKHSNNEQVVRFLQAEAQDPVASTNATQTTSDNTTQSAETSSASQPQQDSAATTTTTTPQPLPQQTSDQESFSPYPLGTDVWWKFEGIW